MRKILLPAGSNHVCDRCSRLLYQLLVRHPGGISPTTTQNRPTETTTHPQPPRHLFCKAEFSLTSHPKCGQAGCLAELPNGDDKQIFSGLKGKTSLCCSHVLCRAPFAIF